MRAGDATLILENMENKVYRRHTPTQPPPHQSKQIKMNNNFLQLGQTIECGRCHPEKFEDCVSIQAKFGHKCECVCHRKPPDKICDHQCPQVKCKHGLTATEALKQNGCEGCAKEPRVGSKLALLKD